MNRYKKRFELLRETGQKAFMPFTVLGWPDRDRCLQTIRSMIENGASALELGIAFSDPVADGPVIQRATFETLESGFKTSDAFALIKEVRSIDKDIPIGVLVYYNVILAQGVDEFFKSAKDAGIDGVLVADLPVEGADEVAPAAKKYDIDLIFIVSPVTTPERIDAIVSKAGGFLYLVSRLGVTGTDKHADQHDALTKLVASIKSKTDLPICAGFGIADGASAKAMIAVGVDGVIVGSRVVELVRFDPSQRELAKMFAEILETCKRERLSV